MDRHFVKLVNLITLNQAPESLHEALLTTPGICFSQQDGAKLRTCGLREYLVKVAWRAATTACNGLQQLYSPMQTMGQPNGCINAAKFVQGALDKGRHVKLCDCVNAHPSWSRHALRHLMTTHKELVAPLFAIWNFTFTRPTYLHSYNQDGTFAFSVECRTGALQGCTSAGPCFNALLGQGVMHAAECHPRLDIKESVRMIADDTAIAGREGHPETAD
jgi:hypothetical protein